MIFSIRASSCSSFCVSKHARMMPRPLQIRAPTWLSTVPSAIARMVTTMHDFPYDPPEVFNRAAGVFRMAAHMLGERLLVCRGLVVSLVNDDLQAFPRRRD